MSDLVRVSAETPRQVQATVNGTTYTARRGFFEMKPADAAYHAKVGNIPLSPPAGPVGKGAGYRCADCGFASFFVTCSRCSGHCEREV